MKSELEKCEPNRGFWEYLHSVPWTLWASDQLEKAPQTEALMEDTFLCTLCQNKKDPVVIKGP